jgi:K+-transporting ATPase ATPase C chain
MKVIIRSALFFVVFAVLCGVIYPLITTAFGMVAFPFQASGSMLQKDGKTVGSALIGQSFTDDRYFQGRVSAVGYNTYPADENITLDEAKSGSDNLAPSNPKLKERIQKDLEAFLKANPTVKKDQIPASLFFQSFSGLDPDITIDAAKIQVPRIAKAAGIDESKLNAIINTTKTSKFLGIFGDETVNVLKMNIKINDLISK